MSDAVSALCLDEPDEEERVEPIAGDDPMRRYLGEIGKARLLTAEDEVEIGRRIEAGQAALRRRLMAVPLVRRRVRQLAAAVQSGATPLDDVILFAGGEPAAAQVGAMTAAFGRLRSLTGRHLQQALRELPLRPSLLEGLVCEVEGLGDRPALRKRLAAIHEQARLVRETKRRMIEANLRLVVSIAKRYYWSDVPLLDRIQDGNLGLMKAVDRLQYRRGFKFSTYAIWWIRQSIVRGIADRARTIRIPAHLGEALIRLRIAQGALTRSLGREPTSEELAARLALPLSRVEDLLRVPGRTVSLQAPIRPGEDTALGDLLEDMQVTPPDADALQQDMTRTIRRALDTLSARERDVVRLRFGIGNGREHTLDEIGEHFSVSRERIRQIEVKAIRKLQQLRGAAGLRVLAG